MTSSPKSTGPEQRLADLPNIPHDGVEADSVAVRATYRVRLTEAGAQQLEALAEELEDAARVALGVPDMSRLYIAAGMDLLAIAMLLEHYSDHGGDGVRREEIPLAGVVLAIATEVTRLSERLSAAVTT